MDAVIIERIAKETALPESSVSATIELFEKGATGPFIVRYRKEMTGGLDEVKVRLVQERLDYYREVREKKAALRKSLSEQGKLTDEIRGRIDGCLSKVELEDLHQRFRSKKKTRSSEAMEKGLEPLAEYFWNQEPDAWSVEEHLKVFVEASKNLSSPEEALQGVVDIIAEWIGTNFEYRRALREMLERDGFVISNVVPAKVNQKTKYAMYYERREPVTTIPSHRVLAIRRGCKEGILISSIEGDHTKAMEYLLSSVIRDRESIFAPVLEAAVRESYTRILKPLIETEVRTQLKERADLAAIRIFQENLANLLLSPPAGPIAAMGLDWGKDEECSVAVVSDTGSFLEGGKVRFTGPRKPRQGRDKYTSPGKGGAPADQPESREAPASAPGRLTEPDRTGDSGAPDPAPPTAQPEIAAGPALSDVSPAVPEQTPAGIDANQETAAGKESGEAGPCTADYSPGAGEAEPPPPETGQEIAAESTDPESAYSEGEPAAPSAGVPAAGAAEKSESADTEDELQSAPREKDTIAAAENSESAPAFVEAAAAPAAPGPPAPPPPEKPAQETETGPGPELKLHDGVLKDNPPVKPLDAPAKEEESGSREDTAKIPENEFEAARETIKNLITKHKVRAISIGTGPRARELEVALRRIITEDNLGDILIAAVNDAGVAIYSSSRIAREEFPDWTPSARCAVSLARRLQDPLAELVKIDPKLIGVGQYQHDVDQKELHRKLLRTVQFCVNRVGVHVNTAGESLLRYVSGLNDKIARRITAYRKSRGAFPTRASIPGAVGMDTAVYEQAAGFLRIPGGENVLDGTAVHPESYPVVEKMAAALEMEVGKLVGNREKILSLKLEDFATEAAGIPTLKDIREELLKPGRDPRKSFKLPKFRADVISMSDLETGMTLEGVVTNVTNFGAFVDIGVKQDGLIHLSQMSNRFIRDPREAVKVGDIVQVKVISVETETKRIGLSMKALLPVIPRKRRKQQHHGAKRSQQDAKKDGNAAADPAASAAPGSSPPSDGDAPTKDRTRPERSRSHSAGSRNKGGRKPERAQGSPQKKDPAPEEPERSLREKIAILQSKFRRIN
ncbi:MAG: S1 RNA-binding domain-containing protein [Acidobacteria bacterium]|nr:S1 RNA-binding domain-containing protein [Acidobacteriota bacterium]